MTVPHEHLSEEFRRAAEAIPRWAGGPDAPGLDTAGTRAVEAWFLGPRAENAAVFEELILEALRDHVFWRRNYHPGDPTHITEEIKRSPQYLEAVGTQRDELRRLLGFLKKSVPFFSMRYQGHMNWDLTLPGLVGYFAAMLYNPNNVAFEGSTATTVLELLVGDDLCHMLGYTIPASGAVDAGAVRPWGHVTCDGTVANIEAVWAARNLRFLPSALRAAFEDPRLAAARALEVGLPTGGTVRLVDADPWTLLNLPGDDVLALPGRLTDEYGIDRDAVTQALAPHSVQTLGLGEAARRYLGPEMGAPVLLVPGTKHYSFPKAAALLGLGAAQMIDIPVDLDARLDVGALRGVLERCLDERRPVYAAVAVMGSTEESAVDPLADVVALRDEFRGRGLEFTVHADAAWGGYHASTLREDSVPTHASFLASPPPPVPLSAYVRRQYEALGHADSITVDPHKAGYIPYPAGALCYRNGGMRDLVSFSAPVVFHGDAEPTVGIYGVEGSKPGAAVASIYLSHRVIRPSRSGHGAILGQALFSAKKLYARLLTMAGPGDRFVVVPVSRLPAEVAGEDVDAQVARIRELVDGRTNDEIEKDPAATELVSAIGPDQNILAYAFNFRRPDGSLNTDLTLANNLNRAIYDRLSIDPGEDIYGYDLVVSTTDLDASSYGQPFVDHLKHRLGVGGSEGGRITVLRSVVMDPWITETAGGSFIDVLEGEFRKAVSAAVDAVDPSSRRGY